MSWNPVSEATGYQVQWRSGEDQDFATADVPGDTTEYTIRSLEAGTEYTVQVIATKENADDGPPSVPRTGTPEGGTPEGETPSDDATPPTVTITTTAGLPTNAAFTVTITFSESVTGLALTDLEVSNGAAGEPRRFRIRLHRGGHAAGRLPGHGDGHGAGSRGGRRGRQRQPRAQRGLRGGHASADGHRRHPG